MTEQRTSENHDIVNDPAYPHDAEEMKTLIESLKTAFVQLAVSKTADLESFKALETATFLFRPVDRDQDDDWMRGYANEYSEPVSTIFLVRQVLDCSQEWCDFATVAELHVRFDPGAFDGPCVILERFRPMITRTRVWDGGDGNDVTVLTILDGLGRVAGYHVGGCVDIHSISDTEPRYSLAFICNHETDGASLLHRA